MFFFFLPDPLAPFQDGNLGTPDLRNRFIVGAGSSYQPGNVGGADSVTLSTGQLPGHRHALFDHSHTVQTNSYPASNSGAGSAPQFSHGTDYSFLNIFMTGFTTSTSWAGGAAVTDSAGGGAPIENRPPFFALSYIMKL